MAEYEDREHYIPLRRGDLIEMVCGDPRATEDQEKLRSFCTLISSIYHFEYHERMEKLKNSYAPFDPDSQTTPLKTLEGPARDVVMDSFFEDLTKLMEKANYTEVDKQTIEAAMDGASDWGLDLDVNFDIFNKYALFVRGDRVGTRTKRHRFWLWKKVEKKVDLYQRAVLVLRFKEHKAVPEVVDTEGIYLKLIKDIPKADLEMIFPGGKIKMPKFTKGKLLVSLVGTVGYFIFAFGKAMLAAAAAAAAMTASGVAALFGPMSVLGGYAYKQWYGYNVTKQTYSKQLTESLYYQTLDNNNGVLTHLVDEAEEQECREAILAYWALLYYAPEQGWTTEQLDDYIELHLDNALNMKVDFEVDDALDKVLELGIVQKEGAMLKAVPLDQALERLDYKWDNYFQYNV